MDIICNKGLLISWSKFCKCSGCIYHIKLEKQLSLLSSLPLVCIHLVLFYNFIVHMCFILTAPTHVMQVSLRNPTCMLSSFNHLSVAVTNLLDNHLSFSSIHVLQQLTYSESIVLYLLGTTIHMSIHVRMQVVSPSCDILQSISKQITIGRLLFLQLLVAPFQKNLIHCGTRYTTKLSHPFLFHFIHRWFSKWDTHCLYVNVRHAIETCELNLEDNISLTTLTPFFSIVVGLSFILK